MPKIALWASSFDELTCLKEFPHSSIGQSLQKRFGNCLPTFPHALRYVVPVLIYFVLHSSLDLEYVRNEYKYAF